VDAFADTKLKGQVTRVNAFPDPQGFGNNSIRQYGVNVAIIDPPKSIRIGMTAFAEIDIEKNPDK
jgi:hypothetical protein